MFVKTLLLVSLIGILGLTHYATAAPGDCRPGPAAHTRMPGPPPAMPAMMEDADIQLTDEQQTKMDGIMKDERKQTRKLVDELMDRRAELMKLADEDNFNEASVRSVVNQIVKLESELMFQRIKTKHQIDSLLSDEQKTARKHFERARRPMPFGGPPPMPGMEICR